jgi:hypothetical protein
LPTGGTESLRGVFEGEDLAARVFSAGGVLACADGHPAALAVDPRTTPARRSHPGGRWRLCRLVDGSPVTLDEFDSPDAMKELRIADSTASGGP